MMVYRVLTEHSQRLVGEKRKYIHPIVYVRAITEDEVVSKIKNADDSSRKKTKRKTKFKPEIKQDVIMTKPNSKKGKQTCSVLYFK